MKKVIFIVCIMFIFFISQGSISFAEAWNVQLSNQFNWVETFDQYEDWQPTETTTALLFDENFNGENFDGPVVQGTSDSEWNTYGTYDAIPPAKPIIQDHGTDKVVTGKSLMVGYNAKSSISTYEGDVGVFKPMIYFGDGSPSGYSDMYFFARVFIPENYFPTAPPGGGVDWDTIINDGKTVKHVPGNSWAWMSSHKWISFGTGFLNTREWKNVDEDTTCYTYGTPLCASGPYGGNEIWVHLKNQTFDGVPSLTPKIERYDGGYQHSWGNRPIDKYLGKLIGIEVHLKVETIAGVSNDGVAEIWLYDETGTPELFLSYSDRTFLKKNQDGTGFNRLWFIGNIRVSSGTGDLYYTCGQGMNCVNWIDDIIIHDERIGPTYYNLLTGDLAPPSAPTKTPTIE